MARLKTRKHFYDIRCIERPRMTLCGKESCEMPLGRCVNPPQRLDARARENLCAGCERTYNGKNFQTWLIDVTPDDLVAP